MASKTAAADTPIVVDDEAPGPPISVPDSGEHSEGGKLKMIVGLVKKALGVKDIAAMRLSLPASLLEPVPNLEYWGYLDRPDVFASINDSVDPFVRMLSVCRFVFTKDIKFIHGRVVKPYNSVLGEHFRCHWDVPSATYDEAGSLICHAHTSDPSAPSSGVTSIEADTASVRSSKSTGRSSILASGAKSPSTAATTPQDGPIDVAADMSNLSLGSGTPAGDERIRVVYVTEQVSHHPPISSFYASAPSRHVEISGVDQISAKVSGTTLRVSPGTFNKGLFVNITGGFGEGESYHITHPVASVNGILRGSFYVTVGDSCIITQTGNKHGQNYRAILEYKEEGWISKARYLVEGVIHTYHQGETAHEKWLKVKDVPKGKVVAVLEGCWRGVIKWKKTGRPDPAASAESSPAPSVSHLSVAAPNPALGSGLRSAMSSKVNLAADDWQVLLDLTTLRQVPKVVRPIEKQEAYESQKLWEKVTSHLLGKRFSEATNEKVAIEQRQRDIAAERKRTGEVFVPALFKEDISDGQARLTEHGSKAVQEELKAPASYPLEGLPVSSS
ncbi:hypothetical protein DL96DRAFT_1716942 [Flagelloscypha sp. PMI_526]|nr:hypothetical protein DL96DRAFT_1716942 [Flagelloscypha sp. PMI_526]